MGTKSDHVSGSTDGRGIKVTGTTTGASVTVHTATSTANECDYVTIEAFCAHTAAVKLSLEWGAATDPDDVTEVDIPINSGWYRITDRKPIKNGLVVKAFAATANVIVLAGRVERTDSSSTIGL